MHSVSAKLQVVVSDSASDRLMRILSCVSVVMCTALYAQSAVPAVRRASALANILLGAVVLILIWCDRSHLWCWNNWSQIFCVTGITWWILHSHSLTAFSWWESNKVVAACQPPFRCTWHCLHIIVEIDISPIDKGHHRSRNIMNMFFR